jgi:CRP-like cAMP-binding protein
MVDTRDLTKISFFKDLPGSMLGQIASIAQMDLLEKGQVLFRQGQVLDYMYALASGGVYLNSMSPMKKILTLDEVLPGECFGLSTLIGTARSSFTAVCSENSNVITLSGEKMTALFEADKSLGFAVMTKVTQLFKSRMDKHTKQFVHSIATHPDIAGLV